MPQLADLAVQAKAHILAWLDKDYWTAARIMDALAESGATAEQIAEVYSLAAAALLTDAFGGRRGHAATMTAHRLEQDTTRHAQMLVAAEPS
jgi:hypothetical protein